MQINYDPLLKLRLAHSYFSDGNTPAVSFIPTNETDQIMRNLEIRMVARDFGVELFFKNGESRPGQLLSIEAPVRLSFLLRPTDPLFHNYTDLHPIATSNSIRYLSNLGPQQDQPAGTFLVANGENITARPRSFDLEVKTPGTPISLKDELGNEIHAFSGDVASSDPFDPIAAIKEDGSIIRLNLPGASAGFYTLWEAGEVLEQFILPPQNWMQGDLGLLSVYLGDTGANGKHILIDGAVIPQDFNLVFTARKTKWRYYLIDSNNTGYANQHLLDTATQQPISPPADGPVSKPLPDGSTAMVLTTPTAIPLRQQPDNRFTLSMKPTTSDSATAITINLPSATANGISTDESPTPDASEVPIYYSDMYVYL